MQWTPRPIWVKPQLAKLVEKAPEGHDWLHESKPDQADRAGRLVSLEVCIWAGV
jgi:hypothetical protein